MGKAEVTCTTGWSWSLGSQSSSAGGRRRSGEIRLAIKAQGLGTIKLGGW